MLHGCLAAAGVQYSCGVVHGACVAHAVCSIALPLHQWTFSIAKMTRVSHYTYGTLKCGTQFFKAAASSFGKIGLPSPVTGSHPAVALNPYGRLNVPLPMALLPLVTSVNASWFL